MRRMLSSLPSLQLLSWLWIVAVLRAVEAKEKKTPIPIHNLDRQTFDVFSRSHKNAMILYYNDDCGNACQVAMKMWENVYNKGHPVVLYGSINCSKWPELCNGTDDKRVNIETFPTVLIFRANQRPVVFDDAFSTAAFVDVSQRLADHCNIKELMKTCGVKERLYYEKWTDAKNIAFVDMELQRVKKLVQGKMKPDVKLWIFRRINVLEQILADETFFPDAGATASATKTTTATYSETQLKKIRDREL